MVLKRLLVIMICFTFSVAFSQDKTAESGKDAKIREGYDNLNWGTLLSKARSSVRGKIDYTDEKTVIISKDDGIIYRYGFFDDEKAEDGKLFYVSVKFPYLSMQDVLGKLKVSFGEPASQNLIKNQGAIAWNSEKTIVVMSVYEYEKMPYCSRIIYVSKDIAKEINTYQKAVFFKKEMELIKKLNP